MTDDYPELGEGEAFEGDVRRLLAAVNDVLRHGFEANRREKLVDAAANVDAWYDKEDDPRSMGWVDDRGRP
jgi:hypothetical protein